MRKLLLVSCLALAALTGCEKVKDMPKSVADEAVTAAAIVDQFKAAGLPVQDVEIITAGTDENKLLGRPNQYTSKVNFYDSRHLDEQEFEQGEHYVEVFANADDAKARRDYVTEVTKGTPFLTQYQLLEGTVLVRLDKVLTPDEVAGYEAALK